MAINARYLCGALVTFLVPAAHALQAFPEQLTEDARAVRSAAEVFSRSADGVIAQELGEREGLRERIDGGADKRQDAFGVDGDTRVLAGKLQTGFGLSDEKRKQLIQEQLRGFVAQLSIELRQKNFEVPPHELERQQREVERSVNVKGRVVCLDFHNLHIRGDRPCATLQDDDRGLDPAVHSDFFNRLAKLLYEENVQILAALQAGDGYMISSAAQSVSSEGGSARALAGGTLAGSPGADAPLGFKDMDAASIEAGLANPKFIEPGVQAALPPAKPESPEKYINEGVGGGGYVPSSATNYGSAGPIEVPAAPSAPRDYSNDIQRGSAPARSAPAMRAPAYSPPPAQPTAPAHSPAPAAAPTKKLEDTPAPTRSLAQAPSQPKSTSNPNDLACTYLGGKYCQNGGGSGSDGGSAGTKPGGTYVNDRYVKSYFRENPDVQKMFKSSQDYEGKVKELCKRSETEQMSETQICAAIGNNLPECRCEEELKRTVSPDQINTKMRSIYSQHAQLLASTIEKCKQESDAAGASKEKNEYGGTPAQKQEQRPSLVSCTAVARTAVLSNFMTGKFAACRLLGKVSSSCDFTKSAPTCMPLDTRELSGVSGKNQETPMSGVRKDALNLLVGDVEAREPAAQLSTADESRDILKSYLVEKSSMENVHTEQQPFDGWPKAIQAMSDRCEDNGPEKYSLNQLFYNLNHCRSSDHWGKFLENRRAQIAEKITLCKEKRLQKIQAASDRQNWTCEKTGSCKTFLDVVVALKDGASPQRWQSLNAVSFKRRESVNEKSGYSDCDRLWREANLIDTLGALRQFQGEKREFSATRVLAHEARP